MTRSTPTMMASGARAENRAGAMPARLRHRRCPALASVCSATAISSSAAPCTRVMPHSIRRPTTSPHDGERDRSTGRPGVRASTASSSACCRRSLPGRSRLAMFRRAVVDVWRRQRQHATGADGDERAAVEAAATDRARRSAGRPDRRGSVRRNGAFRRAAPEDPRPEETMGRLKNVSVTVSPDGSA